MSAAITIEGGWLSGHTIRKARKPFACEYYRGKNNGGYCRKPIKPGEYYVEGEYSVNGTTRNGVFLVDKYCPECAGEEAVAAVSEAAR